MSVYTGHLACVCVCLCVCVFVCKTIEGKPEWRRDHYGQPAPSNGADEHAHWKRGMKDV